MQKSCCYSKRLSDFGREILVILFCQEKFDLLVGDIYVRIYKVAIFKLVSTSLGMII